MPRRSTKPRSRPALQSTEEFSPFGPDPLAEAIRTRVREVIEETVEEELTVTLGRERYERQPERRGYRNCRIVRTVTTTAGKTEVSLPRARLEDESGWAEWRPKTLRSYERRTPGVDNAVVQSYLCGTNTRRLKAAFRPLLKDSPLSKSVVSRLVTRLQSQWEAWQQRPLSGESYVYLFLDGFSVKTRCAGRVTSMMVLGIVGVRSDGYKEVLALHMAGNESEAAWKSILDSLVARGLDEPQLCVIDGAPGLIAAVEHTWPKADVQRCTVHKLRNLLAHAPHHATDAIRDDYHAIVYSQSEKQAQEAHKAFISRWRKKCRAVVDSLLEAGEQLLTFYRYPRGLWQSLKTTNIIERLHGEFRRRVKTQSSLPTEDSVSILLFGLVASGQIQLRRMNGWLQMTSAQHPLQSLA